MAIIKEIQLPNMTSAAMHIPVKISSSAPFDSLDVTVNSYLSVSSFEQGAPFIYQWSLSIPIATLELDATTIESALVKNTNEMLGGTLVPLMPEIDRSKIKKWALIKQARSQAEYAGFTWDGSTFDSDAISQNRITGAVTLANLAKQLNQPYEITWTLADNSTRTLSADEMILVGLALGQHVQFNFNKGQQLYKQIQQATTKEEVEAITW